MLKKGKKKSPGRATITSCSQSLTPRGRTPQWLELPISGKSSHCPKDVQAIEVRVYLKQHHLF